MNLEDKNRYRQIVENFTDEIWVMDLKGEITVLNSPRKHLPGFTGENIEEWAPSEITSLFRQELNAFLELVQSGQVCAPMVLEGKRLRKDGSTVWTEVIVSVLAEDDQPVVILGVNRDITARKQADQALHESEERLHQITASLREVIWLRDVKTRQMLYVNPAFEQLCGVSCEEFYKDPDLFINLIHPEDAHKIIKGRVHRSDIHRIVRPDGEIRWVWGRTFPVMNEAGEIYRAASIVEDITDRKRTEEELMRAHERLKAQMEEIQTLQANLREQVIRDPLTGLYNRRYLYETLDRELARAEREGYPVSLVMVDVDNFKRINDTYGHDAGDRVLINLAHLLTGQSRISDLVCRLGGDEFLLIYPKTSASVAFERAEMFRKSFHASVTTLDSIEIRTTLSLGIAIFPDRGVTAKEVLRAADHAMYRAKANGRNRTVVAA